MRWMIRWQDLPQQSHAAPVGRAQRRAGGGMICACPRRAMRMGMQAGPQTPWGERSRLMHEAAASSNELRLMQLNQLY